MTETTFVGSINVPVSGSHYFCSRFSRDGGLTFNDAGLTGGSFDPTDCGSVLVW